MSSSYSANQYNSAFRSQRLQNWCETKPFEERPRAQEGHTAFIASGRGHLLPAVKRGSAWPDFKGTWDLPSHIQARPINPTGRSSEGLRRLKSWGFDPQHETNEGEQQDGAASSSSPLGRPASRGETRSAQNQDSQAGVVGSSARPADGKPALRADAGSERPLSKVLEQDRPPNTGAC